MNDTPLPRPPAELLDMANAYQRSKTLFALAELGVPTLLARRSLPLAEIARALRIDALAADRFLNAGVAIGLLERVDGEFRNTALAEQFLVRDKPAYLGDLLLRYDRTSYAHWSEVVNKLRAWRPGASAAETPREEDQGHESLRAQHNLSFMTGHALGEAYDFSRHRLMLDLGGGTGSMSLGVCGVWPHLRAQVYDLPPLAEVAREFIRGTRVGERVGALAGDFKTDELPAGFDVALLANLLSTASEETNRELFRCIHERLPADGAIILSGWLLEDDRTGPLLPVLFCLEDILWQAPDVERAASTYQRWLAEVGFVEIEHAAYCPPTSMIVGRKRAG
ncbi:MAG: methyltransferase [Pyrinomonadaceae bacterium]